MAGTFHRSSKPSLLNLLLIYHRCFFLDKSLLLKALHMPPIISVLKVKNKLQVDFKVTMQKGVCFFLVCLATPARQECFIFNTMFIQKLSRYTCWLDEKKNQLPMVTQKQSGTFVAFQLSQSQMIILPGINKDVNCIDCSHPPTKFYWSNLSSQTFPISLEQFPSQSNNPFMLNTV